MKTWIFSLLSLCSILMYGQTDYLDVNITLPQIALLDIEPNNSTIELKAEAPSSPGDELNTGQGVDDSKWINYTSTSSLSSTSKKVVVQIIQGEIPSGMEVRVIADNFSGSNGDGVFGISSGSIVLSTTPKAIISNIGGAFTGDKKNNGHKLTFSLHIINYELMNELNNSNILLVSYTLMDN
mgnify:CR=1 FL=1